MPLFIDKLPIHTWTDNTRNPPVDFISVRLPILPSDSGAIGPPLTSLPQDWVLDTGFTGEAFAWRYHLESVGVDPDQHHLGSISIRPTAATQSEVFPLRDADLWLFSNLTPNPLPPFRLELAQGIVLKNAPTQRHDPILHRALIGMRCLRRARLRVELDLTTETVSVWTPDSP